MRLTACRGEPAVEERKDLSIFVRDNKQTSSLPRPYLIDLLERSIPRGSFRRPCSNSSRTRTEHADGGEADKGRVHHSSYIDRMNDLSTRAR